MIELNIPLTGIMADLISLAMVVCIVAAAVYMATKPKYAPETFGFLILSLYLLDLFAVAGSAMYMQPTNGLPLSGGFTTVHAQSCIGHNSPWADPPFPCQYPDPATNPFNNIVVHPWQWTFWGLANAYDWMHGAVSVSVT